MITLYHSSCPELARLADKAAWAWMIALTPARVMISPMLLRLANVIIRFGQVDRSTSPARVAQHEMRGDMHFITLAADVTWRISWWQRFAGIGQEDAYAALLHEFGHAMGLPHSDRNSDVMAPDLGTTVISPDEAERYCQFLDTPSTAHFANTSMPAA